VTASEPGGSIDASGVFTPGADTTSGAAPSISVTFADAETPTTGDAWVNANLTIYTAEDMFAFAETVNNGTDNFDGKVVRLANDIDLSGAPWIPIGWVNNIGVQTSSKFAGTFDGDGYTISGLTYTAASVALANVASFPVPATFRSVPGLALFGITNGATIKNLTIGNPGETIDTRGITTVYPPAEITSYAVAAIVALAENSDIVNCVNNANIIGDRAVSGIVHQSLVSDAQWSSVRGIVSCINYGNLTTDFAISGIAKEANKITNSANYGNLTKVGANVGNVAGIAGTYYSPGGSGLVHFEIDSCFNAGTIVADAHEVGGIFADIPAGTGVIYRIANCYNTGNITQTGITGVVNNPGNTPIRLGGIGGGVGNGITATIIQNCYNTGILTQTPTSGNQLDGKNDPIIARDTSQLNLYADDDCGITNVTDPFKTVNGNVILKWQTANPAYTITFSGEVTVAGRGTDTTFTLPIGRYSYTAAGGASGSFNVVSGNKHFELSATVTFDLPDGASVAIDGKTQTSANVYTLTNGTYAYTVTQPGKAPRSGNVVVAGANQTITITALANLKTVAFDADGAAIEVRDSAGEVITPTSGTYSLAEGAAYTYTATKSSSVGIIKSFNVTAETDTILVRLDAVSATVTFAITPAAATIVVKDGDATVIAESDAKVYKLKSGKSYSYTVSAEGYADDVGTITASTTTKTVTLETGKVSVTFNISPSTATLTVKQGGTTKTPISGRTYTLDAGAEYTYSVSAANYESESDIPFIANAENKIITKNLVHTTVTVTLTVPSGATAVVRSSGGTVSGEKNGDVYTYTLNVGDEYEYSVSKSGYTTETKLFTVPATNTSLPVVILTETGSTSGTGGGGSSITEIAASTAITEPGTYLIKQNVHNATITISTPGEVKILGTGVSSADKHNELEIKYAAGVNGNLTISDLYVHNGEGATGSGATGLGKHIVDFAEGTDNTLTIAGTSLFDQDGYIQAAAIHIPYTSRLTMSAPGSLYMYKRSQGSGIGGDSYEASGEFTFTGGSLYIKGSKTGALIGGDAGAPGAPGESTAQKGTTNKPITFSGNAVVVLIAKAQGAAIGASHLGQCAGDVFITDSANVTVISDFNAGVGKGGGAPANTPSGTLTISSTAKFTPIRTGNSYYAMSDKPERARNGDSGTAYIDGGLIYATVNGGMHLFTYETNAVTGTIAKYTESTLSTMANFGSQDTKTFYEYLPAGENTRTLNGKQYTVTWNGTTFDVTEYKEKTIVPVETVNSATEAVIPDLAGSTTIEAPAATVTTSASGAVTETTKVETVEVAKSVEEAVKIVEAAKADGKADAVAEVKIVVKTEEPKAGETPAHVTTAEVELIVEAVKTIAKAHDVVLTIESEVATITLDSATLEGIAEGKADGDVVIISATTLEAPKAETAEQSDAPKEAKETLNEAQKEAVGENTVIDLTVTVGGKAVHDFKGEVTVASPYTPPETVVEEDYDLLTVYYVDDDGNIQEIKGAYFDPKTKQIVFKTTHFSKFMVAEWINPFSDIAKGEWYYKSVRYGVSNELLGGIDGKFLPRTNSSRATMIVLLAKLAGIDIDGGTNWYDKAIEWGVAAKITDGTNPMNSITREQLFQLLYNYSGAEVVEADFSQYTDADKIHDWALPGMNWAIATGLATGRTATTLNATEPITRSEVVTFLQKFLTAK
jgi:hypothetical protein